MNIFRTFRAPENIANADVCKCFDINTQGRCISLTAEQLKETAKNSTGISALAEEIQIKHLVAKIDLINNQLTEIDKKIEKFSVKTNSPIITIPRISHFSGTSILSEIGNIYNYSKPSAGVAPYEYEPSQFRTQYTSITKNGSKYLMETLYQIITPVIRHNEVFQRYYNLKQLQRKIINALKIIVLVCFLAIFIIYLKLEINSIQNY